MRRDQPANAGISIALGSGVVAGLGIVAAVLFRFDMAYGLVFGAALGVIFGLLGDAAISRDSSG